MTRDETSLRHTAIKYLIKTNINMIKYKVGEELRLIVYDYMLFQWLPSSYV